VIVDRIKDDRAPFYRPPLPKHDSAGVHPDILALMKQCWTEEPFDRPSFWEIAKALRNVNKGKSVLSNFSTFNSKLSYSKLADDGLNISK